MNTRLPFDDDGPADILARLDAEGELHPDDFDAGPAQRHTEHARGRYVAWLLLAVALLLVAAVAVLAIWGDAEGVRTGMPVEAPR